MKEVPKTFVEHVEELRRLFLVPFLAMFLFTGLAFWQSHFFIKLLQQPLDKTLYYSSPIGGFTFIFQVAIVCGLLVSLPLFVRAVIKFLEPVMAKLTSKLLFMYLICSIALAAVGVFCGYAISLPSALHFLNGFESGQLKPLISANEYLSFTLIYLAGFAILFQMPLIMTIINRIKPLKPRGLMQQQKKVIAGSFIAAAILTPTPDIMNQLIFAAPMILLFQVSVGLIWVINMRRGRATNTSSEPGNSMKRHESSAIPEGSFNALGEKVENNGLSHLVGAVYEPMSLEAETPRLRPIDIVLAGS